jgi:hypothetical protein
MVQILADLGDAGTAGGAAISLYGNWGIAWSRNFRV